MARNGSSRDGTAILSVRSAGRAGDIRDTSNQLLQAVAVKAAANVTVSTVVVLAKPCNDATRVRLLPPIALASFQV